MQKIEFDPYDFSIREVDGVKIYYKDIPLAPCTHVRWVIEYGSSNDPEGKEGTAHFLEHLLFDGNPMLQQKSDIEMFSRKYLLDSINAYTSFYNTVLTCRFLSKNQDIVMDAISNIVYKSFIRDEDIEHERKVITQEMWARLINPTHIEYLKQWNDNVYKELHNIRRMESPGGWIDTVAVISKEDLQNASKSYVKENTHIVLTGDVSKELLDKVAEVIKTLPSGDKIAKEKIPEKINPAEQRRWTKTYAEIGISEKKQTSLSIYRVLEKVASRENILTLTSDLLGYLLMKKLRQENSWCYSVSTRFSESKECIDQNIHVRVAPENADDAENIIWQTIQDIIENKHAEDFETSKQIAIDTMLAKERVSGQIADGAESFINIEGKIWTLKEMLEEIEKTTYEDVVKHLSTNFKKEDVFTEVVV